MSTAIAFDTLKFAVTLRDAGVPAQQAEAQARAFAEIFQVNLNQLVTKEEFDSFRAFVTLEFETTRKEAKSELAQAIAQLENKMNLRFAEVERRFTELEAKIDGLDSKIDHVRTELSAKIDLVRSDLRSEQVVVRWMLGFVLASLATLIVRLFFMKGV